MCRVNKESCVNNNTMYKQLVILKIKDLYEIELAKFFLSQQNNELPFVYLEYFQSLSSIHNYNTRGPSKDKLYLLMCSYNLLKSSLYFEGVQVWNSLPMKWKRFSQPKFINMYKHSY